MMRFASPGMRRMPAAMLVAAVLACALPVSANDWVNMGTLGSAANGHIWSRVINEAGNTQGRNEEWKIPYTARARLDFQLLAPNAGQIDARIRFKGRYGDEFEYLLSAAENVAPGGYRKVYGPWDPDNAREMRIVLSSRAATMDQRYQLIVTGLPQDKPAAAPTASAPPTSGLIGTWNRSENGKVVESMRIQMQGSRVEVIYFDAKGAETGRVTGDIVNDAFTGRNQKRQVKMTIAGNQIKYWSANLDGGSPWQGNFTRMGGGG